MLTLLRIEWMKMKNYKAFLILGIFFILGIFTANYIVYTTFEKVINESDASALINRFNPYDFKYVWQTVSYTSGFLLILPSMLLIILTTNEYTFRTNRQNIIDGWSRGQFIDVKLMLALLLALLSLLIVVLTGCLFGAMGTSGFSVAGASHLIYFFVKALSYNLLALMVSVLIRKTGLAIGIYFVYMGAENILAQMLDVLSLKIKKDYGNDWGSIGDYLPMNASDGLLTFPSNPLKKLAESSLPTNYTGVVIGCALIYLALFFLISRWAVLKNDL